MTDSISPRRIAFVASTAPPRTKASTYPEPFFSRMAKREKRPLGDLFGLKNFGVNLTRLAPGGESALLHRHSRQDEFIYVLEGVAGTGRHVDLHAQGRPGLLIVVRLSGVGGRTGHRIRADAPPRIARPD